MTTNDESDTGPAQNTDREIWREVEGDAYAPSVHVTQSGGIGIDVGGLVVVLPVREWHSLASRHPQPVNEPGEQKRYLKDGPVLRLVRLRFFRDLVQSERVKVYEAFGIDKDDLPDPMTLGIEQQVFDQLFVRRAASIPKVEPRASTVFQAIRGHLDAAVSHADVMAAIESALEPSPSTSEGEAVAQMVGPWDSDDCLILIWLEGCERLTAGDLLYAAPQPTPVAPVPGTITDAARDVLAERKRQVEAEGWSPEHDDEHRGGSLAMAAACYAAHDHLPAEMRSFGNRDLGRVPELWPRSWDYTWFKPKDRRRDLVKAGALILAEIERLDRAALSAKPTGEE